MFHSKRLEVSGRQKIEPLLMDSLPEDSEPKIGVTFAQRIASSERGGVPPVQRLKQVDFGIALLFSVLSSGVGQQRSWADMSGEEDNIAPAELGSRLWLLTILMPIPIPIFIPMLI